MYNRQRFYLIMIVIMEQLLHNYYVYKVYTLDYLTYIFSVVF